MSGLHLRWLNSEQAVLIAPRSGSPADLAGLKEGDVIVAINSKRVSELSKKKITELLQAGDGRSLKVSVLRGENVRDFKIVLKRRI